MSQTENNKTPLHIITGFLGVGKTTAIINLLSQRRETENIAVIVNEFGEVGIDGSLIEADGKPFNLVEVPGGCICCASNEMLMDYMGFILNDIKPTRIIIEPSGIARPSDLIFQLKSSEYKSLLDFRPVITLIDPALYHDEDFRDSLVFDDQIESADIAIITRTDLSTPEKVIQIREELEAMLPAKQLIIETTFGQISAEILDLVADKQFSFRPGRKEKNLPHDHSFYLGKGWIWETGIFNDEKLSKLFTQLAGEKRLLRAKGIFVTPENPVLFEIAGGHFHKRTSEFRHENRFDLIVHESDQKLVVEIKEKLDLCIEPGDIE